MNFQMPPLSTERRYVMTDTNVLQFSQPGTSLIRSPRVLRIGRAALLAQAALPDNHAGREALCCIRQINKAPFTNLLSRYLGKLAPISLPMKKGRRAKSNIISESRHFPGIVVCPSRRMVVTNGNKEPARTALTFALTNIHRWEASLKVVVRPDP
jgi:hypothetical protein